MYTLGQEDLTFYIHGGSTKEECLTVEGERGIRCFNKNIYIVQTYLSSLQDGLYSLSVQNTSVKSIFVKSIEIYYKKYLNIHNIHYNTYIYWQSINTTVNKFNKGVKRLNLFIQNLF